MRIKSLIVATAVAGVAALGIMSPAAAGSPHFIKNHTTASPSGFDLNVSFKEAGLESGSVETITASADLDASYQCVNNGGHNPDDAKKTVLHFQPTASGEFEASKNGNVEGTLTLTAPEAGAVLDCPNGQTATLTAVTWSNATVTDEDTGAFLAIDGGPWSFGSPVD